MVAVLDGGADGTTLTLALQSWGGPSTLSLARHVWASDPTMTLSSAAPLATLVAAPYDMQTVHVPAGKQVFQLSLVSDAEFAWLNVRYAGAAGTLGPVDDTVVAAHGLQTALLEVRLCNGILH